MINALLKIGWEGGGSTSIWIMSANTLLFFLTAPLRQFLLGAQNLKKSQCQTVKMSRRYAFYSRTLPLKIFVNWIY